MTGKFRFWTKNRYNISAFLRSADASHKNGKVVVGAVMRKMIDWMFGVLKSGQAFDPALALAK